MGRIQFHDFNVAFAGVDLPNVDVFKEQIEVFKEFLIASAADAAAAESQSKDIGFLLSMGELFTLVAYGQLIIEYRDLQPGEVSDDLLDQIFDFMVRDFSKFALEIHQKHNTTEGQMAICRRMIRRPAVNRERFARIFDDHVLALKGAYRMND